mgnify:CR=1 FL=1
MHHLQTTPKDFPDYKIRACTNTGVWLVDQMDPATGTTVAHYDFVNKDYTGPDTGGATLPIETLGGSQERDFLALQKTLNKALLN